MVSLVEYSRDIEVYTRRLSQDVKAGPYKLRKPNESAEIKVCIRQYGYIGKSEVRAK